MKKYSLAAIVGGLALAAVPAGAVTTTFQFNSDTPVISNGGTFGDKYVFTEVGGISNATIFGYSNATSGSTTGANFQTAELGQSTGTASVTGTNGATTIPLGLTVCNQNEGLGCGSPQHQVDNNNGFDFVLIEFSAKVDLTSLTLSTYQGNGSSDSQDFEYAYGTGAFPVITPGSTSVASLMGSATQVSCTTAGFNTLAKDNCDTGASNTYSNSTGFSSGANGATWVMIGAQDPNSGGSDYFKISQLVISTHNTVTATPEPGTFGLIGLALAGLGAASRKFKSSRS
jgi:PEP-CTERM motif